MSPGSKESLVNSSLGSHSMDKETLIFNGTGINYSWHMPKLAKLDFSALDEFHEIICISGASTCFAVFLARSHRMLTWKRGDFLNWNKLACA